MDDFEIKISKVKRTSHLLMVEVLGLIEVHQVLVVSEDLDGEGGSVEVMSPELQGMDDCEKFSVVNVVVMFGWDG